MPFYDPQVEGTPRSAISFEYPSIEKGLIQLSVAWFFASKSRLSQKQDFSTFFYFVDIQSFNFLLLLA